MTGFVNWPPDGAPIIDEAALDAIREVQEPGAPDLIAETVALFLSSTPAHLAALGEAVASRDSLAIRSSSHAVKGSCWLLGLVRLGKSCEALEQDATEDRLEHAPVWLGRVEAEYELAIDALHRAVASGAP